MNFSHLFPCSCELLLHYCASYNLLLFVCNTLQISTSSSMSTTATTPTCNRCRLYHAVNAPCPSRLPPSSSSLPHPTSKPCLSSTPPAIGLQITRTGSTRLCCPSSSPIVASSAPPSRVAADPMTPPTTPAVRRPIVVCQLPPRIALSLDGEEGAELQRLTSMMHPDRDGYGRPPPNRVAPCF